MSESAKTLSFTEVVMAKSNEETAQWLFLVLVLFIVLVAFIGTGYYMNWITWNGFSATK